MAHEVENMFSVAITPWHGLGKVITHAPNMEAVLQLAGLDWNVSLKPMFIEGMNGEELQQVDYQAITRNIDNSVLGYVTGQRYKPLQNVEALEFFRPFQESGLCTFETAGSLRGGKKIWILARLNSGEMEIANGDVVRKYLLLSNAHDGKTGIRIGFCPIRVVCANTLALAHSNDDSKLIRLFHSHKVLQNLEALRDTVNVVNQRFEATADQYRALTRKQVNRQDIEKYVTKVFYNDKQAETDREKLAREKLNNEIEQLFQVGYGNTNPAIAGSAWALYNAATQYLSYNNGRSQEVRLDSLWFGQGSNDNIAALEAAIRL